MPDRLTIAEINLQHYAHNISQIKALVPDNTVVMAVVKANAYGHGIEQISRAAIKSGVGYIGVVSLGELRQVRRINDQIPILLINYIDAASIANAVRLDASITVMDMTIIKTLEQTADKLSKQVKVHIKIDTGMHRAGCAPSKFLELAQAVAGAPHLQLEGIYTHFAESESLDEAFTRQQLKLFNDLIKTLHDKNINPPLLHCANSAAILHFPEAHFTMVRPGLVTYGLNPFPPDHRSYDLVVKSFKPVLSLKTQVIFVRDIERGEGVSYNQTWVAERPSRIALLPVGYGDGYRRSPHNAKHVLVSGEHAPIVGSVTMDQTLIDITDIKKDIVVGDEVVLIGRQGAAAITTDDVASAYQTINYEVATTLTDRVTRIYNR